MKHQISTAFLSVAALAAPTLAAPSAQQHNQQQNEHQHPYADASKPDSPAPRHDFDPKSPAPLRPTPEAPAFEFDAPAGVLRDGSPDFARPHFSQAADGLWAVGSTYKARFGADGFEYVPYFGSSAPRNFPLELDLVSATCDGSRLRLDSDAAAQRDGDRIDYPRGPLTERYELASNGVEQVFVVHELARRGELNLRIAYRGEYQPEPKNAGVRFVGEHGEVHVSGVQVFDAAGRKIELPLGLREGELEIAVPAAFVAQAALPITIDPLITTFTVDATALDFLEPDSAYDLTTDTWRVVCQRVFSAADFDLWSAARDSNGVYVAGSGVWLDLSVEKWSGARIANNRIASTFLVVSEVGAAPTRAIRGRTVSAVNSAVGASFTIDGGEMGDKHSPDVGGDPSQYAPTYFCVTWQRDLLSSDTDIHARMVLASGSAHGSTILLDNTGSTLDERPAISDSNGLPPFDSQSWMIVWQRNLQNGNYDLRAARIRWDGVVVQHAFTTLSTPQAETFPSVSGPLNYTGGERRYMIAYQVVTSFNNTDIEVRVMEGASVAGHVNLSLVQDTAASRQVAPSVTTDGYQFAIAYCEDPELEPGKFDVYVDHVAIHTLTSQISQLVTHELLSADPGIESSPRIASAHSGGALGSRAMVAWDVQRTGHRDVLGALVEGSNGVPIESFCYGSAQTCPCGNAGHAFRGCANSANPFGAALARSAGFANLSDDNLQLIVVGTPATASLLIFESANSNPAGMPFGDGRRCVTSPFHRTRTLQASGGMAFYPQAGDAPLSQLDSGLSAGGVRYYQAWYRDPGALCGGGTFNLTNAVKATWLP